MNLRLVLKKWSIRARRWTLPACGFCAVFAGGGAAAGPVEPQDPETTFSQNVDAWWNGRSILPRWKFLDDHGVEFRGFFRSAVFGVPAGGLREGTVVEEELRMGVNLDLEKLLGWDGLSLTGSIRWRDGENPANLAGSYGVFSPSPYQSGKGWRVMPFYASWSLKQETFLFRAGNINPYEFFLQMPLSTAFVNSAFSASKGLSGTGVPWSSSYASWGGFGQVRMARDWWVRGSASLAIPGQGDTRNHGMNFLPDSESGLYALLETEYRPRVFFDSQGGLLPGKTGIGGACFGVERNSFDGEKSFVPHAFYAFAEQMIFREPGEVRAIGEKQTAATQGMHVFAMTNLSNPDYASLPFFVGGGLVYEGLLPGRPRDLLGVAFAWGEYSRAAALAEEQRGIKVHATREAVLETDYRLALNRWAYAAPFLQFIMNPSGTGQIPNALVLGVNVRVEL